MGVGSLAYAQDQDDEEVIEEIIVTGSRIKRADIESVSPLTITSSEEIRLSGFNRIEDMLNSLPQIEASQNAFISNGSSGAADVDLRGLGSNRTLVLINGRRMQPGGVWQQAPDINQIPTRLVERIEVITGGASSVYGADAVAGVVNFIMRSDFEGVELTAGTSFYLHNNRDTYLPPLMDEQGFEYPTGSSADGQQYDVSLLIGSPFADGRGHATMYMTFRKVKELRMGARDYASCALNTAGDECGGSGNAIVPNFYVGPIVGGLLDWGVYRYLTLDPNSDGFIDSIDNVYNYAPINHIQRPDERWAGGGFAEYEINDLVTAYSEFSFMRDRSIAQIAESGTFFAEEYHLSCSTPLLSATQLADICGGYGLAPTDEFAVYIGKRNVEGGPRADNTEYNSFRMVAGARGDITASWSYDISMQYGSTASSSAYINDFFGPRIADAVQVELDSDGNLVCISGGDCIPYEVFTYQGITTEQAVALTGVATRTGITKEYVANAYVSGDLGVSLPSASDPVSVVLGVEYRKEVFNILSDTIYEDGMLLGQGGPSPSIAGDYNVKEIFSEALIPLVQDKDMIQNLSLELGLRYSDYNTSGGSTTYKIGASYEPVADIKIRGSYNRAVRAANVGELFRTQSVVLWSGTDPCAGIPANGDIIEFTQAQCALTGMTAAQYGSVTLSPADQYYALAGGNPNLSPETAKTWTIGVVANPLEGFRFSVDYWDIKMADVISTIGPERAIRECATTGNAAFCDLIQRAPSGSLWLGSGDPTGRVIATNQNLSGRHWKGVDISADYEREAFGGIFQVDFLGTIMLKKHYQSLPGDEGFDCKGAISGSCFPQPEWRHSVRVNYDSDSFWAASVKWRYFGAVNNPDVDTGLSAGAGAQSYIDMTALFEVTENASLLFGVNNVFDKSPPIFGSDIAFNANTVVGYYDTLGRYIHMSATLSF